MHSVEHNADLPMEDRKRPSKKRPCKGRPVSLPELKKSDKSQRKSGVVYTELEICEEIHNELDDGIIHDVSLRGVYF